MLFSTGRDCATVGGLCVRRAARGGQHGEGCTGEEGNSSSGGALCPGRCLVVEVQEGVDHIAPHQASDRFSTRLVCRRFTSSRISSSLCPAMRARTMAFTS